MAALVFYLVLLSFCLLHRHCPHQTIPIFVDCFSFVVREYLRSGVRSKRIVIVHRFKLSSRALNNFSLKLILLLLLISGGIHPNPGPIKHPCSICDKSVRSNQKAIQCDGCLLWSHCVCNDVDNTSYHYLTTLDSFDWYCTKCLFTFLPFNGVSDSFYTIGIENEAGDETTSEGDDQLLVSKSLFNSNQNHGRSINIALINVRSLLSCVDDVWHLVTKEQVDLLAVTETWLDDTISDGELCSSGYSIIRTDRNRHGGGVAFMVSNRIPFRPRIDIRQGEVESVWIELFPGSMKRSIFVACVYRSPSTSPQYFFDNLMSECESDCVATSRFMLMGDFNCNCMTPELSQTKLLDQFCVHVQLQNLVLEPTRLFMGQVGVLDLILTNQVSSFSDIGVTPFAGSDHHMVSCQYFPRGIKISKPHKYMDLRSYRKLKDPETIRKCLNCLEIWSDLASLTDIDSCVECFTEIIQRFLDMLCPVKRVRVANTRPAWLDYDEVKHARKMKKLAHNKALKLNDSVSWNAYRNARNFANMKIKTYKMKFLEDQSQVCAKSFWKQIGYINGKSNSISNCCLVDHDVNDINDYFLSVPMNTIKGIVDSTNFVVIV